MNLFFVILMHNLTASEASVIAVRCDSSNIRDTVRSYRTLTSHLINRP